MIDYKAQGKRNRRAGADFELATRNKLIKMGYLVDKWTNNIDLEEERIVIAKANPFNRFNRSGVGFPDFLAFMPTGSNKGHRHYVVVFVECKVNGTLNKLERQKMNFLMKEGYTCWVARKGYKMSDVLFEKLKPFKFNK